MILEWSGMRYNLLDVVFDLGAHRSSWPSRYTLCDISDNRESPPAARARSPVTSQSTAIHHKAGSHTSNRWRTCGTTVNGWSTTKYDLIDVGISQCRGYKYFPTIFSLRPPYAYPMSNPRLWFREPTSPFSRSLPWGSQYSRMSYPRETPRALSLKFLDSRLFSWESTWIHWSPEQSKVLQRNRNEESESLGKKKKHPRREIQTHANKL
jgi:hypothetical protein